MNKQKKPQKTAAQIESAINQTKRLLILSVLNLGCWFVTKLQSVLLLTTTVISTVIDGSVRDRIDALINALLIVSYNIYNALCSCLFWSQGRFGTQNAIESKFYRYQTYLVQRKLFTSKLFERIFQKTANTIIAQPYAKILVIGAIRKRLLLESVENFTAGQLGSNKKINKLFQFVFEPLKFSNESKIIPWLHSYFWNESIGVRCKQNRQNAIVSAVNY